MKTLRWTTAFKRDLKRERKTNPQVDFLLDSVLAELLCDGTLEARYRDHFLTGRLHSYRECHIKPDLLLVYALPDEETVLLVRLGSHAELGLE